MSAPEIKLTYKTIAKNSPAFVIAEIGHNHQGDLEKAKQMIKVAADCGADAVKFQKRFNKNLFTKAMYDKPYDNENSFGATYGEHREFLEFNKAQFIELIACAKQCNVEFMCTAFDVESADFLEDLGIASYKIASGDLTNTPLLEYIAKRKKPMFVSTGASDLNEVRTAYDTITKYNDQLCFLHTTCIYPADYPELHLRVVQTLAKEFPKALVGYSGHDNGILAATLAYMLGANVIEKHFTMNRSWKGTDHKFSLEPEGLRKQVRDLRRVDIAMGSADKKVYANEASAKSKMGKSIYAARALPKGCVLKREDVVFKSPAGGLHPYQLNQVIGRRLMTDLPLEGMFTLDQLE